MIPYTLEVKARVMNGAMWSAMNARSFVSEILPPIRVTEIMYNPAPPSGIEIIDGFTDNEMFEFLEIQNIGTDGIDLTGAHFTSGFDFTFEERILEAGETIVLVKDAGAFASRYGGEIHVAGVYDGSLDNSGERIRLKSATGETLIDFTYSPAWHPSANGAGYSLVPKDLSAHPDAWSSAEGWRPSTDLNGSPGGADSDPPGGGTLEPLSFEDWQAANFSADEMEEPEISGPEADPDHDGVVNLLEYAFGTDPEVPQRTAAAVIGEDSIEWGLPSLEAGTRVLVYARRKGADTVGVNISPMFSNDLDSWEGTLVVPTVLADDDEIEVVSIPIPEGKGFCRIEVLQEE
jgi:hypothetical protein